MASGLVEWRAVDIQNDSKHHLGPLRSDFWKHCAMAPVNGYAARRIHIGIDTSEGSTWIRDRRLKGRRRQGAQSMEIGRSRFANTHNKELILTNSPRSHPRFYYTSTIPSFALIALPCVDIQEWDVPRAIAARHPAGQARGAPHLAWASFLPGNITTTATSTAQATTSFGTVSSLGSLHC